MSSYRQRIEDIDLGVESLSVLDIGSGGYVETRLLSRWLKERNVKQLTYRGIEKPSSPIAGEDYMRYRNEYRRRAKQTIKKHKPQDASKDVLVVSWDAADVPYPFSDESFNELHCHMITSPVVRPNDSDRTDYFGIEVPTTNKWVKEARRLLMPDGRIFLTAQALWSYFFQGGDKFYEWAGRAEEFLDSLERNDFKVEAVSFDHTISRDIDKKIKKRFHARPTDYYIVNKFTQEGGCASMFTIAQKR
ncbi:MAG: hypothetical protein HY513_05875 [Candidatus Aenigmarchaeota archaeon]|nr:hypothetical protein [Candidatus Aenigmarchaeota archaeon]